MLLLKRLRAGLAPWIPIGLLALAIPIACKTPAPEAGVTAAEGASPQNARSSEAVSSLKRFAYDLDPVLLKEMGARLGCEEAARWAAYPKSGNLRSDIAKAISSRSVYDTVLERFFEPQSAQATCQRGGAPAEKGEHAGIEALRDWVKSRWPDDILTVVVHGGFGTHLVYETALDESIESWYAITDAEAESSLDFWQFKCSNSFAPSGRCAKEMLETIGKREEQDGEGKKRRYLLWGYGRGANALLEALKGDVRLRDKTIGLVTMGAPIGGSAAMELAEPLVRDLADSMARLAGIVEATAASVPQAFLQMADYYANDEQLATKLARLLTPEEVEAIRRGADELKPEVRQAYLRGEFKASDFSRSDGTPIRVFHTAGLLDVATLRPTPDFTVEGGAPALTGKHFYFGHLASLGLSPAMRDYPLSDAAVALQHAVIPKDAMPKGLETELLGLFKFDHFANRLTPPVDRQWEIPHLAIVDAILDTVAQKLEGGAS